MYSRNKILNKVTDICISLYEISLSFKDEIKTMNKFKALNYFSLNDIWGIGKKLENSDFIVKEIEEKEVSRKPSPPFITSSLQMEASRKLGMSAKNTMQVAQRLYQNGLITYMRTDGVQIGEEGISEIRSTIDNVFGNEYVPEKSNIYSSKITNAQEAHEAIRPNSACLSFFFQGLITEPKKLVSLEDPIANSSLFSLPNNIAPLFTY